MLVDKPRWDVERVVRMKSGVEVVLGMRRDVVSYMVGTLGEVRSPPLCEENLAETREGR